MNHATHPAIAQPRHAPAATAPASVHRDPLLGLDGLDVVAARAALAGNDRLYRRLLGMFVDQHPALSARLAAALAAGDAAALARDAHDLSGLAHTLGMRELSPLARSLEHACRDGHPFALIAPLVDPVAAELRRLVGAMAPLRPLLV